jgi:hypothetical protein
VLLVAQGDTSRQEQQLHRALCVQGKRPRLNAMFCYLRPCAPVPVKETSNAVWRRQIAAPVYSNTHGISRQTANPVATVIFTRRHARESEERVCTGGSHLFN